MDIGKERSMSKSKNLNVEECWIPGTPAKPGLEKNQETRPIHPHLVDFEIYLKDSEAKKAKLLESAANSYESSEEREEQVAFWGMTNSDIENMWREKDIEAQEVGSRGLPNKIFGKRDFDHEKVALQGSTNSEFRRVLNQENKSLTEQVALCGSTNLDCGSIVSNQENKSSAEQLALQSSSNTESRSREFNQENKSLTEQVVNSGSTNSDHGNHEKETLGKQVTLQGLTNSNYRWRVFNQEKQNLAEQVALGTSTNLECGNRVSDKEKRNLDEQVAFWGCTNSDFGKRVYNQENKSSAKQVALRKSTNLESGKRILSPQKVSLAKQATSQGLPNSDSRSNVFNQENKSRTKQVAVSGSINLEHGNRVNFQINKTSTRNVAFQGSPSLPYSNFGKTIHRKYSDSNLGTKVFNGEKESFPEQVAFWGLPNSDTVSIHSEFNEKLLNSMPFTDLLRMVDNGSTNIGKSSSLVCSPPKDTGLSSLGSSCFQNQNGIMTTLPLISTFDLNTPARNITEFAPLTPSIENLICELQNENDQMQLSEEKAQEKPKRKRHRPKVIKEGQPKRARKTSTPKQAGPGETTSTGKRKYVRKQVQAAVTPPAQESKKVESSCKRALNFESGSPNVATQKSCKRSLNFEFENQAREEVSIFKEPLSCNLEPPLNVRAEKTNQDLSPLTFNMTKTSSNARAGKTNQDQSPLTSYTTEPSSNVGVEKKSQYSTPLTSNKTEPSSNIRAEKTNQDLSPLTPNKTEPSISVRAEKTNQDASPLTSNKTEQSSNVRAEKTNQDPSPLTPNKNTINPEKGTYRILFPNTAHDKAACSAPNFLNLTQSSHSQILQANHMMTYEYNNNNYTTSTSTMHGELVPYNYNCSYSYNYDMARREVANNQVVLFKREEAVVPFVGPVRRRKERPKVDLDDETSRVWNLLIQDINSEGVNGTADKAKWWEEERRVFRGRADSFVARMHLIQGDRRFSKWKGSVVDSVVGVFLTQNVADHASSSAFMSLASRFPLKPKKNNELLKEDSMSILVQEPEVSVQESTDSTGFDRSPVTVQHVESSSQNFADSPTTQPSERAELSKHKDFESYSSFVQLMELAETTILNHNLMNNSNVIEEKCLSEESQLTGESTVECTVKILSDNTNEIKSSKNGKEKEKSVDWDIFRKKAEENGKRERTSSTMDSIDYEEIRRTDVNIIADAIKERGMNNRLAERIKEFLNRIVSDHGSIDLEWLRDIPPDRAKEYLLSIRGLGLKSVECVRLLTLHHLAFPVDTNVGRIAVRLGWVPLQPLPESLQLHLLELYPMLESIQKYLWPRLCKLDQKTLYELHYQMITFGKVFCTKNRPNCNACPLRGECRHFASAFASARLALPAPEEEKKALTTMTRTTSNQNLPEIKAHLQLLPPPQTDLLADLNSKMFNLTSKLQTPVSQEPIIDEPASPEPEIPTQTLESDIEDAFYEDPDEIPTIRLNLEEFTQNLQSYMEENMELQEIEMSKALVALTPDAASIPVPKLKNVNQLRTEHQVYELPDSHPLIAELDRREPDDPCPYLLAIWTPGETAESTQVPERTCNSQECGKMCDEKTCFSCNNIREANTSTVRGTILIPCRTANRGSFPLNGTYFQVNEVFADHESSLKPIDVPRSWIWNLPRRTVYFGTSIPTIFKGLSTEGVQYCFWRGFVCVRGYDRKTRAPRPLMARLHFPASRLATARAKAKAKTNENHSQTEPRHPHMAEPKLKFSQTFEEQRQAEIQKEKMKVDLVIGILGSIPEPRG